MTATGGWPTPPEEPVIVLLEAHGAVEHEVLERWVRENAPPGTPVETMDIPAPGTAAGVPEQLVEAALAREDDPWLAPVRVVWVPEGRGGDQTVHVRDVLRHLGDPRHPRAVDQRRILRRAPERCRVAVADPARLSSLHARCAERMGEVTAPALTDFLLRQGTLALERAESRMIGSQYKVPRLVREELLDSTRFRDGLAVLAQELGRDEEELRREATSYLEEMVTGWSRLLIDLGVRLGRRAFKRGYDTELDYDPSQLTRLRELAAEQKPLVFLPSHKSNLDTLVVNVALHDNGLPKTHVFGGNNMAFWPIGPIFRHAGIAYIRRDSKGDAVYKFSLREYIGYLVEKRFSLQFYIEGGRSRTGKLLPPKLGLLAYVADAVRQGRTDDVVLVPVSIAYDQLQEVGEYVREARGERKGAEGVGWLLRATREQHGRFGKIHVRFGEPLSLQLALTSTNGDDDAYRLALQKVALEVSRRINEVTPITAISLVTLSLLGAQGRALTLDQVRATVHDPLDYARRKGLPLTPRLDVETDAGLQAALQELERHHVVSRFADGPDPVYAIGADQHVAAAFYRNSVIHFFLTGAIVQVGLARVVRCEADETDAEETFWDTVLGVRDLLKFDFFFEPREDFRATVTAELDLLDPTWRTCLSQGAAGARTLLEGLRPLTAHAVLRSFLEAYSVVGAALSLHEGGVDDEKAFVAECLALGRQFHLQQRIHSPESLSKPLFAAAMELAGSRDLLAPAATADARRAFLSEIRAVLTDIDVIELGATARVTDLINAG